MNPVANQIKAKYRNCVLPMRLRSEFKKQKDFADQLGIAPQILSEIESNKRFLSSTYALRITEVLGCSLDDLFEPKHINSVSREDAA